MISGKHAQELYADFCMPAIKASEIGVPYDVLSDPSLVRNVHGADKVTNSKYLVHQSWGSYEELPRIFCSDVSLGRPKIVKSHYRDVPCQVLIGSLMQIMHKHEQREREEYRERGREIVYVPVSTHHFQ